MHAVAISGSLRRESSNGSLVRAAAALAPASMRIEVFEGLTGLPYFNPDLDRPDLIPAPASAFRELVGSSSALLISCPEYAHGIPGAFKNALDWLVGDEFFAGLPVAIWNASPRATHAPAQLREVLLTMAAQIVEQACVTLPQSLAAITPDGTVGDLQVRAMLTAALDALAVSASRRAADVAVSV